MKAGAITAFAGRHPLMPILIFRIESCPSGQHGPEGEPFHVEIGTEQAPFVDQLVSPVAPCRRGGTAIGTPSPTLQHK